MLILDQQLQITSISRSFFRAVKVGAFTEQEVQKWVQGKKFSNIYPDLQEKVLHQFKDQNRQFVYQSQVVVFLPICESSSFTQ